MPFEIRVPNLGESVLEAVVAQWIRQPGESVAAGEPVVELETEKVNQEIYAEQGGVLASIARQTGETVGVGELLGLIEAAETLDGQAPPIATAPAAAVPTAPLGAVAARDATPVPDAAVAATPVARRLASASGVDLERMQGTGPSGRITKRDVTAALDSIPVPEPPAPQPVQAAAHSVPAAPAAVDTGRRQERVRMSRRRQTIARRLVEAQHTAAMLTTFNEVDMSAIMDLRRRRRESFKERFNVGLGFMSFFTRAVVGGLRLFPQLNAEIQGDEMVLKHYYDIGIAVGTDEGLVVPVVRDADRKTFAEIERAIADLAARARTRTLTLADLQGGTFTITNGGVYGSLLSTPILNTPQVGILGMHKIQERAIVVAGTVQARPMMYLALSYDHRIVDGGEAVRFLVHVKELLEDPEALLLEG